MVGRNIFEHFLVLWNCNPKQNVFYHLTLRSNETLVFRLPPYRLFLGMTTESELGEGKEAKRLGTRQILCGFTDIFALLSS